MQRYFINHKKGDILYLHADDIHHVKKVMRYHNGDSIIAIDNEGHNYICKLIQVDTGEAKIIQRIDNDSELDVQITLIYALPKGDKLEMVIQKATELGVSRIVPLQANRCVVKTNNEKYQKRKIRYQKIAKEASEQSYRNQIPTIEDVIVLSDIEKYKGTYTVVAFEEDAKIGEDTVLTNVLKQLQAGDSMTIIVGCEGGFDKQEIQYLQSVGIQSCSLGKRILRSETAPLYMLSVIGYMRELGE